MSSYAVLPMLNGIELDILEDGGLDLPDSVLARLDIVIGAVHSGFDLPRAKQTKRILCAMNHPNFTLLAHPCGRLIERRAPYDVDMLSIFCHAGKRGCFLELNVHPEHLDLFDIHCHMAREEGVLVSINSDAHSVLDFHNLRYGVGQARRGLLEQKCFEYPVSYRDKTVAQTYNASVMNIVFSGFLKRNCLVAVFYGSGSQSGFSVFITQSKVLDRRSMCGED